MEDTLEKSGYLIIGLLDNALSKYVYVALNDKLNPTIRIFIFRAKMMDCPLRQNISAKNKPLFIKRLMKIKFKNVFFRIILSKQ